MSLLGVFALVGIVVNNAIVLLEVIEAHRKKGADVETAIKEAVARRIRPILLTAATTVAIGNVFWVSRNIPLEPKFLTLPVINLVSNLTSATTFNQRSTLVVFLFSNGILFSPYGNMARART